MGDFLMLALILVLILRASLAQTPSAPTSTALSMPASVPGPATAVSVPDVPPEQSDPVTTLDGSDESDNSNPGYLTSTTVAQIVQENAGGAAPTGAPPIPTASSAYSYAAGYRGWTRALAQANINALAALSDQVWAGTVTQAQFQAQVQDPNVYGNPAGDPVYSADSLYYTPDQWLAEESR
jgi:hypothetical protein